MLAESDGKVTTPTIDQTDALVAALTVISRVLAHPPAAEVLDSLLAEDRLSEWPVLGHDALVPAAQQGLVHEGLNQLRASRISAESQDSVAQDHRSLTVGPGTLLACPYESVYRSKDGLVFEAETLQVRSWYSRFGLEVPQLNREPDDHIHLELEFCAHLLQRGLTALELADEDDAQRFFSACAQFCRAHLLVWGPVFFKRLHDNAATSFYCGVALLGMDLLGRLKTLALPK